MTRHIGLVLMLSVILLAFVLALTDLQGQETTISRDYYVENALSDTGAKNVVAAILLDYRLLDSIFEAAILLVASAGVLYLVTK